MLKANLDKLQEFPTGGDEKKSGRVESPKFVEVDKQQRLGF
jgi:hypothetical protein